MRINKLAKVETYTVSKETEIAECKEIMKNLLQGALKEQRSMSDLEQRKYDKYANRLAELETENRKESKSMNKNLTEFRNFLTDETQKTYVENRSGETLLADNGAVVPQYVAQHLVKVLNEESTLFADMNTFTVVNGELSVPREKVANLSDLVFVGENVKLAPSAVAFDAVKIQTKRCGTAVKVSDQFIQESGVQIESYVLDLLGRRLSKGLDYHAVKGTESIEGLDTLTKETHGVLETTVAAVSSDNILDMVTVMNPYHLQGAKFVVSRPMFQSISKVKDGQGNYLLQVSFRDERPMYRMLGIEVEVTDAMDDDKIYLVNMTNAYAKVIRNAVRVKKVDNDEENALSAMNLFVLDMFVGAKCVDGTAISRLKIQG